MRNKILLKILYSKITFNLISEDLYIKILRRTGINYITNRLFNKYHNRIGVTLESIIQSEIFSYLDTDYYSYLTIEEKIVPNNLLKHFIKRCQENKDMFDVSKRCDIEHVRSFFDQIIKKDPLLNESSLDSIFERILARVNNNFPHPYFADILNLIFDPEKYIKIHVRNIDRHYVYPTFTNRYYDYKIVHVRSNMDSDSSVERVSIYNFNEVNTFLFDDLPLPGCEIRIIKTPKN